MKKIRKESKSDNHKINVTHIEISNHVEGRIEVSRIFNNQECFVWFSIDNWKTFQEASAIEAMDGTRFSRHSASGRKTVPKKVAHKYTFDFIIPQQGKGVVDLDDPDYDIYGRPYNLQFHVVVKSESLMYLDNNFKIYVIKLKQFNDSLTKIEEESKGTIIHKITNNQNASNYQVNDVDVIKDPPKKEGRVKSILKKLF